MTRSSTLRCAAVFLLAASFLPPAVATADERPRGRIGTVPAEPASFLAGLWGSLVQFLPDDWRSMTAANQVDNGWQIDPDGASAPAQPAGPSADNGWLIDPNG
jgi:hypothetical protein